MDKTFVMSFFNELNFSGRGKRSKPLSNMLLLENNQIGNFRVMGQVKTALHHLVLDYFPITACCILLFK